MSHREPNARRAYHRVYYRRNAERLNTDARRRYEWRQQEYWCLWLLANLEWPEEPTPIYPKSYPIRRPLLRLPRRGS